MMRKEMIKLVIFKDLLEIKNDKTTLFSLFLLPLIFSIILPTTLLICGVSNPVSGSVGGLTSFINNFQGKYIPSGLNPGSESLYAVLIYFFLPLFLLIPIMISTIIASSSFVGEKEKKTLEGLLYTPVSDRELILGKILASAIPAVILTWISILMYGILLDSLGFYVFGKIIFPNVYWILMGGIVSPLITFLSIALVVVVSQRAKTTKSAQSVAMILLLPILGIVISQASGLFLINVYFEIVVIIVLLILDILIFNMFSKKINREKLILNA